MGFEEIVTPMMTMTVQMTSEAELTASEISALEWPKIPASSLSAISEKFAIIVTTETLMIIFFVSSTDIKLFFSP